MQHVRKLRDAAETVLRGKFLVQMLTLEKKSQISNLSFHLKLEKKEQHKPKSCKKEEINVFIIHNLVAKLCPTFCKTMDYSTPGSSAFHYLLEFAQVHKLVMLSNYFTLCHSFLLLPSIFPSIKVLSLGGQSTGASTSVNNSSEYSGLISFRIDCLGLLVVQRTLKGLLWHHNSKSIHSPALSLLYGPAPTSICTWLLEKPYLWLYGPLWAKWCLCFLIHCLICHGFPSKGRLLISWPLSLHTVALEPPQNKIFQFLLFPHLFAMNDGTRGHDLSFLNVEFQPGFFTLLFHPHQEAF